MSIGRQNNTDWYQQSFGELYLLIYAHRNIEAARNEICKLAKWAPLNPGDTVLDVCCGNGRHLSAILELGSNAVGFDLSWELIRTAGIRKELGKCVFRADIRHIPLQNRFDRVLNLFTSFGYFEDAGNQASFIEMSKCIKSGGVMILDHMNADRIRRTLVPESIEEKAGYRIVQRRRIKGRRVQKHIEVINLTDGHSREFLENIHLYEPGEMIEMARIAGLREVTLHGSFAGEMFESNSERMILRGTIQ
ncbi:class I SAM-dependent methyltransferase [bacterium]|nr:class I SAM-dependent methyltransferase [bacterium]